MTENDSYSRHQVIGTKAELIWVCELVKIRSYMIVIIISLLEVWYNDEDNEANDLHAFFSQIQELAVIVARGRDDSIVCYPVVETIHR